MASLLVYTILPSLIAVITLSDNIVCPDHEYKWIGASAGTDQWCFDNCENPGAPYCPETHCACAQPSPTRNPVVPTPKPTPIPTSQTPAPITKAPTAPTLCTECEECPTIPTREPTSRPDPFPDKHCHCICYGDPHCKMWNCAKNDWQGPRGVYPPGMVYLMTRCYDMTLQNMPFDLIASIQRYDDDFTSIDYTILKIYDPDDEGSFYCIKIKGDEDVQYNDDCSDDYDVYPDQNEVISLLQDKFKIKWYKSNGYTHLTLNIEGDGCDEDIEIVTQTVSNNEESVEIKVSDCYKAFTCGLCGNFYDLDLYFERKDGSHITLTESCWEGTATDATGLSYLIDGTMGSRRRLQTDTNDDEPCFGLIEDIETECIATVEDEYSECCAERSDYCDEDIVSGCKWDSCACVMSEANSLSDVVGNGVLNECVSNTLSKAMGFMCNLPAQDFAVPDMSIYAQVNAPECEDNTGSLIWTGIATASGIWIVIDVIVYFAVIKAKLNQRYQAVSLNSDTDQSAQ